MLMMKLQNNVYYVSKKGKFSLLGSNINHKTKLDRTTGRSKGKLQSGLSHRLKDKKRGPNSLQFLNWEK